MQSNFFGGIKAKIRDKDLDRYTMLGLDNYPPDLNKFVAEVDGLVRTEDPPQWIKLKAVNAHLNLGEPHNIRCATELALRFKIGNLDTLNVIQTALISLRDAKNLAKILTSNYTNTQIKRTTISTQIRSLLSDETQREFAILVLSELDSIGEGDHVPPLVVQEAFNVSEGLKNRQSLVEFIANREPDAKYIQIVKSLHDDQDLFEPDYRDTRRDATLEKNIITARVPVTKVTSPLNQYDHPLAFKGNPKQVATSLPSNVTYREYEDVYLYGMTFGFVALDKNFMPIGVHNPYITPKLLAVVQSKRLSLIEMDELAFFGDSFTPNNYCHFVVDHLPRILWMREIAQAKLFGAFEITMNKFQKAYFDLIGLGSSHVLSLKRHTLYRIKKFKVMNTSGTDFIHCLHGGNSAYANPIIDLVNLDAVKQQSVKTGSKIAFIRPKELGRSFTNNDEVVATLKKYGFDLIDPGTLSVLEQIAMMRTADFVFGIHGAALTNTIYCKPKTRVVEVFPPLYGTLAFYTISLAADLDYRVSVGISQDKALSVGGAGRLDFELPLDKLNSILNDDWG